MTSELGDALLPLLALVIPIWLTPSHLSLLDADALAGLFIFGGMGLLFAWRLAA